MFKRFMQSRALAASLGVLIAAYMVLVKYTTRWEVIGREDVEPLIGTDKGLIAATWHSRFMMLNSAWTKNFQQPYILISRSREGDIVARASRALGIKTIRGSARSARHKAGKGGEAAFRQMLGAIEGGGCVVVTPDGPKGPRQRAGEGPFRLAKHSGAPLVSCVFSARFRKQLNTWDKLIVPLPFGRGQMIWGTPVTVPADASDADITALKLAFEAEMNVNLAQADRALGHAPTEPSERLPLKTRRAKAKS